MCERCTLASDHPPTATRSVCVVVVVTLCLLRHQVDRTLRHLYSTSRSELLPQLPALSFLVRRVPSCGMASRQQQEQRVLGDSRDLCFLMCGSTTPPSCLYGLDVCGVCTSGAFPIVTCSKVHRLTPPLPPSPCVCVCACVPHVSLLVGLFTYFLLMCVCCVRLRSFVVSHERCSAHIIHRLGPGVCRTSTRTVETWGLCLRYSFVFCLRSLVVVVILERPLEIFCLSVTR